MSRRAVRLVASAAFAALVVAACGGGTDDGAAPATTRATAASTAAPTTAAPTTAAPTTAAPTTATPATAEPTTVAPTTAPPTTEAPLAVLRVLVTNDDGVDAPGIDALVTGLSGLDGVEIVVVAPAENQSGTAMNLTDGDVAAGSATTASGVAATAVDGFPADAVRWALANDGPFDLVVSGSNSGQNIGPFTELSGTVGAARYAAQNGIPSIAVSQALLDNPDDIVFADSVSTALAWIETHRDEYAAGEVSLTGINAATCPGGNRGVIEVPVATDFFDRQPFEFDCASTRDDPTDDVDAVAFGFTAISDLPF